MEKEESLKFNIGELGNHLLSQLAILRSFCDCNITGRAKETRIVAASACNTGSALYLLSRDPNLFYSETIMLARSFIEKMINYCYLQVCDDQEYQKFLLYPLYRAYHNSNKSKFTGECKMGLQFSDQAKMKGDSQMQKALALFSGSNPRLNWSKLSVDQKVAVIAERAKISPEFFLMNTLSIYSDASEALHGSLYGCALPTRAYVPGENSKDVKEVTKSLHQNFALLYVQMGSLVHELLKMFPENPDLKVLLEQSTKNLANAVILMKRVFPQR